MHKLSIVGVSGQAGSGKDTVADYLVEKYGFTKIALADPIKHFGYHVFGFTEDQLWGPSDQRNAVDARYSTEEMWNLAQYRLEMYGHEYIERVTDATEPKVVEACYKHLVHWFCHLRDQYTGKLSPRIMLQMLGTEWGRDAVGPNLWIDCLLRTTRKLLNEEGDMVPYGYDRLEGLKVRKLKGFKMPAGVVVSDIRFENEFKQIHSVGGTVMRVLRPSSDAKATNIGVAGHASEAQDFDVTNFNFILNNDKSLVDLYGNVDTYMLVYNAQHEG